MERKKWKRICGTCGSHSFPPTVLMNLLLLWLKMWIICKFLPLHMTLSFTLPRRYHLSWWLHFLFVRQICSSYLFFFFKLRVISFLNTLWTNQGCHIKRKVANWATDICHYVTYVFLFSYEECSLNLRILFYFLKNKVRSIELYLTKL